MHKLSGLGKELLAELNYVSQHKNWIELSDHVMFIQMIYFDPIAHLFCLIVADGDLSQHHQSDTLRLPRCRVSFLGS